MVSDFKIFFIFKYIIFSVLLKEISQFVCYIKSKGSVREKLKGYRLNAIKKCFWRIRKLLIFHNILYFSWSESYFWNIYSCFEDFFYNEDNIFIFSRNVRKSRASEIFFFNSKILWNINYPWLLFVISEWFVWN